MTACCETLFLASPYHYIVISAKQVDAATINISSSDNEVFPMEEDLVNYTQQVILALISIPPEVLLEVSRSGSDSEQ